MAKSRGILLGGVAVVVLLVGGIVLWTQRGGDGPTTRPTTARTGSGSAAVTGERAATPATPARATVIVTGPQGPLAGASVRVAREGGDVTTLPTAANGTVTTDALEPGRYTVSASASGHEPAAAAPREIAAGETVRIELSLVAGGRTLTGTVTDASGGPIAGARIDAAKLGAMMRASDAVATTLTGADGTYSLTVAEGQLFVAASEASYAPQARYVDVGPAGGVADFALVPGGVVEGIVRDEGSREPIAGAIVVARRDAPALQLGDRAQQRAVAGADGRFRLAGLRPGAYELFGNAGARVSRAPTIVGIGVAEQVTDVEILVGRAATVRGIVVDENGAPAPGVGITVFSRGRGGDSDAKSDDKGAFVVEGLGAGRYMLVGNGGSYTAAGATRIEVASADVDGVKVNVERGSKLTGHVEPRQRCEIRFEETDDSGPMHGATMLMTPRQTTSDGAFEVDGIAAGAYTIRARCTSGAQGDKAVTVAAGTTDVVVEVKPGASIAGTIVDTNGKPVAAVTVMATVLGDTERTTIVNGMITSGEQTLTNASGAFELRGLAAGSYRLGVLDRGRPLPDKSDTTVKLATAEAKSGVTITVDRPDGVIRGVVVGPEGKPLPDAWVSLSVGIEDLLEGRGDRQGGRSSRIVRVEASDDEAGDAGGLAPVLTDANGRFEFKALARVPVTLVAEAQAGKLRGQQSRVTPDATITIQALGVTELRGVVRASAPLTWFTVELEGPTREQRTFAAADGTFVFGRIDPGTYKVAVTSNAGNGEARVTVEPGKAATVEIALAANAVVTGTLVDPAGAPVAGQPVVIIPDTGGKGMQVRIEGPPTTSNPDGSFRIEAKAGPSILLVMRPPVPFTKRGLQLVAGQTTDLGRVTVTPEGPDGPPGSP